MGCLIRRDYDSNGKLKPHSRCRKWELQVSITENGKSRKRSKRFSGTQRQAKAELARFEVEVENEVRVTCPLCSKWFASFNETREKIGSVSESTIKQFNTSAASFTSFTGDVTIDKVTVSDCGRWRDDMLLTLKASSVATKMAVLSPAFEQAVIDELIPKNPFRYAKAPKVVREAKKVPKEKEVANMVSMLDVDDPYERAILYITFCGMRVGEVLAVDPHEAISDYILHIHRNMLKSGKIVNTTKGRKDRYVAIAEELWDMTTVNDDDELLCQLPGGVTLTLHKMETWWRKNRGRLGMSDYTIHDLRHAYVTQLCRNGVSPKVIQDSAGHHSIDVTMNVYAHVDNDDRYEAAASIGKTFAANLRQKKQTSMSGAY